MSESNIEQQNENVTLNVNNPTNDYPHNIEMFVHENGYRKDFVVRYIKKYFVRNKHYISIKSSVTNIKGGRPKEDYLLTQNAYDLLKQSYNIYYRYSPHVQTITIMSLENQTVGFLTSCLKDVCHCERQRKIGRYRADLCIIDCIVVECDEFGHRDRDPNEELQREIFIESQGYTFVRFNPNESNFARVVHVQTCFGNLLAHRQQPARTLQACCLQATTCIGRTLAQYPKTGNGAARQAHLSMVWQAMCGTMCAMLVQQNPYNLTCGAHKP